MGSAGREMSISLDGVRDKNLMQLKKLNTALFPVRYNDKYYADAIASGEFTKLESFKKHTHTHKKITFPTVWFVVIACNHDLEKEFRGVVANCRTVNAYYCDICVGSIACRLEKKENGGVRVYIMTLGVLAPYRGLGIGTKLLNHILDLCTKQSIGEVYLHVQTNNDDAIKFYQKFGFEITDTIHNYYTNITPPDCYIVTKFITQPELKK